MCVKVHVMGTALGDWWVVGKKLESRAHQISDPTYIRHPLANNFPNPANNHNHPHHPNGF